MTHERTNARRIPHVISSATITVRRSIAGSDVVHQIESRVSGKKVVDWRQNATGG